MRLHDQTGARKQRPLRRLTTTYYAGSLQSACVLMSHAAVESVAGQSAAG